MSSAAILEATAGNSVAEAVSWFQAMLDDPACAAAYAKAKAELDAAIQVACPWSACVHDVSATTGKILGGMGPVACPCDLLPGSRSRRVDGLPKPSVPVKNRGRHGSRRQRSVARRAEATAFLGDLARDYGCEVPAVRL